MLHSLSMTVTRYLRKTNLKQQMPTISPSKAPMTTGPPTRPCLLKRKGLSYLLHWGTPKIPAHGTCKARVRVTVGRCMQSWVCPVPVWLPPRSQCCPRLMSHQSPCSLCTGIPLTPWTSHWVLCSFQHLGPSCLREAPRSCLPSFLLPSHIFSQQVPKAQHPNVSWISVCFLSSSPSMPPRPHHLSPLDSDHSAGLLTSLQPLFHHSSVSITFLPALGGRKSKLPDM